MNIVRSTLVLWLALYAVTGWAQVTSYSTTPASNNSSPPNGAPEAMAPSAVNDVLREIMADVAVEAQVNAVKVLASVSGTNTITGSMTPDLTAYSAGMIVVLTPAGNNTGATTLNIDSLGALDVQKADGDALVSGDLVSGIPAVLVLDSGADDWILLNPQSPLAVNQGGTGVTSSTGTGSVVLSASPTMSGTVTGGTFAGTHTGNGSGLTGLEAGDIASGTINAARLPTRFAGAYWSGSDGSLFATPTNVSGVVRNSTGNYTVSFSTSFSLAPACTCSTGATAGSTCLVATETTSSVVVTTYNTSNAAADIHTHLVCVGAT